MTNVEPHMEHAVTDSEWPSNGSPEPLDDADDAVVAEIVQLDDVAKAVAAFISNGFADGQTIPHGWFYGTLNIPQPMPSTPHADAKTLAFRYMNSMQRVKDILLTEHSIALKSIRSEGYMIVPPAEQPSWAKRHMDKDLSEAFRVATARATFVRTDGLTNAQRNERTHALSGIATMKAHLSAARAAAKRRDF